MPDQRPSNLWRASSASYLWNQPSPNICSMPALDPGVLPIRGAMPLPRARQAGVRVVARVVARAPIPPTATSATSTIEQTASSG